MGCIYIVLLSKALYNLCLTFTHAHTHSYTVGRGTRAGLQPAQREQLELGVYRHYGKHHGHAHGKWQRRWFL